MAGVIPNFSGSNAPIFRTKAWIVQSLLLSANLRWDVGDIPIKQYLGAAWASVLQLSAVWVNFCAVWHQPTAHL